MRGAGLSARKNPDARQTTELLLRTLFRRPSGLSLDTQHLILVPRTKRRLGSLTTQHLGPRAPACGTCLYEQPREDDDQGVKRGSIMELRPAHAGSRTNGKGS